jgi:hypothetical protein
MEDIIVRGLFKGFSDIEQFRAVKALNEKQV